MIIRYDDGTHWIQVEAREDAVVKRPRFVTINTSLYDESKHQEGVAFNQILDGMTSALMATMSYSDDLWIQERFDNVCRTLIDALTNNVG